MFRKSIKVTTKKFLFVNILLVFSFQFLFSQIAEDVLPYTYNEMLLKSAIELPVFKTKSENINQLLKEDNEFPTPYRYAIFEDVSIDIKQKGKPTILNKHEGRIWRYIVDAKGFKSIQLKFSEYKLPAGARLFIYNEDYSTIYGAFTEKNNSLNNSLMLAIFFEDKVTIEYFEPDNAAFEGKIVLGSIGKGYKDIYSAHLSEDEDGLVGINCPEGEFWQNEKHGVCLITFQVGSAGYTCSGSFINNTRNDGTPYFLTAHHCINVDEAAETCVAYFNYENIGCDGELLDKSKSLSGATLKSIGEESDYALILFNDSPLEAYQPYFAGWDASNQIVESSACVHHPMGLPKKISIDFDTLITYDKQIDWDDNITTPKNTHWELAFDIGQTYTGSSGSPLFDTNKRIVGQLHGGDSENEYYGKFSHSWTNKNSGYLTLKYFLDPDNSGVEILDAFYPATNLPDPQFYPEHSIVCTSAPIKLTAFSAFKPTSWLWDIVPSSITYHEGTSNTSKNPIVSFDTKGNYNISLTAVNSVGNNSIYMQNVIESDTTIHLEIKPYLLNDSCHCNFDSLMLLATGALDFKWSFKDESESAFQIVNDTVNPVIIKTVSGLLPESNNIDLILKGSHGTCNAEESYSFQLIKQENDSIQDAIQIVSGQNGPYSNNCAGIENNEPVPPFTSCTGQNSWCDEYGNGEDIVENSVWFYFIPEKDDNYDISSKGFDNQIAIYLSDSYSSLLSGEYQLIGANDDYTISEFEPLITNVELIAGNTYWIQVDGSAGGDIGQFYMYVSETTGIFEINTEITETLKIYPQPANDDITIVVNPDENNNSYLVNLFNSSGNLVYANEYSSIMNSSFSINISDFDEGIYLINLIGENKTFNGRFIKKD
jgi:PKD repeat protein